VSTLIVPAGLVDVLREAVVCELCRTAGEIETAGQTPSNGIDPADFADFDRFRALLGVVGFVRGVPPVGVQVGLDAHRWALTTALQGRLRHERDMMDSVPATPEGARQAGRATRRARAIEAFLREVQTPGAPAGEGEGEGLRPYIHDPERFLRAGADLTDAQAFYVFAAERVAHGEPVASAGAQEPRHLEMLRLRWVEGFTLREVGEQTGVTGGRVAQLLTFYFGLSGIPPAAKERASSEYLGWLQARIDASARGEDPEAVKRPRRHRARR
jgi:hypothetical protein